MKNKLLLLLGFLLCLATSIAQPTNDECTNPIVLTDLTSFCSGQGVYTNVGATPSLYGPATCFGTTQDDVWFAFTAQATDVSVTIKGATAQFPGGTLTNPQVSIYFGACNSTLSQLECQSATGGSNIVEAYQGGLFVGSTYLIRVQGANGTNGTFQLCLNNYNPPQAPTSDCPTSSILCDKTPFAVQSVIGAGSNISEMNDATCFANGAPGNYESNSTWFVWTCSKSGTLEFTLTPNNIADDLDFVLYKLPNGIGNCQGKEVVRCMASGDNTYPSPCMGPTGLRSGDNDTSEDAGCTDNGDNAWLRPYDMVQGESYALAVNNFTSTGNGFSVEWNGSGEFLGPQAAFVTQPPAVCLGTNVQVIDASSFALGSITGWAWSFGADAVPQTATGPGPHTVAFNTPGTRPIVMTLTTDLGCKITDIQTVLIYPDVKIDTLIAAPDCNGTANGSVTINNITSGTPPYQFSWNGAPFSNVPSLNNLGPGLYTLAIKDANNCQSDFEIDVKERILTADALVDKPLCFDDANGEITLNVTNGKPPVTFNWGNGNTTNVQSGLSAGVYTITAIDNVLCEGSFVVTVTDNAPLELTLDTIPITCFGADNGVGIATASGGVGGYTYLWSDGQTNSESENLPPGTYTVTVTDANKCIITGTVDFVNPPDIALNLIDVLDLICNGLPTGEVRVDGVGGRPPYMFSTDGNTYFDSDTLQNLLAGNYWVKIKDASGCIDSVFATISQPPPLVVIATPQDTTLELGFPVRLNTFTAPVGRSVSYLWIPSTGGLSCTDCPDPDLTAINDGIYIIKITDEDECMAFDTVTLRVNKDRPVYFPNIFAPESAYPNDHFTGFAGPAALEIVLLRIFDRWGGLVFEKRDFALNEPNFGWDGNYKGKKLDGVYTWYAAVRFIDGVELEYEGSITVQR